MDITVNQTLAHNIDKVLDGGTERDCRAVLGTVRALVRLAEQAESDRLAATQANLAGAAGGVDERCEHLSATGVDQATDGPDKVWRCDACGRLYRTVPRGDGLSIDVPVEPGWPYGEVDDDYRCSTPVDACVLDPAGRCNIAHHHSNTPHVEPAVPGNRRPRYPVFDDAGISTFCDWANARPSLVTDDLGFESAYGVLNADIERDNR
jgi:hypothetical protein